MLLSPKKSKFLKSFSNKQIGLAKNARLNFGQISLVASQSTRLTNFQYESLRLFLRRYLKKTSQIFFKIAPNVPITKKPNEVRLGCGKGNVKYWAYTLKKNEVILEIRPSSNQIKRSLLHLKAAQAKLSAKSFVFNRHLRWIF